MVKSSCSMLIWVALVNFAAATTATSCTQKLNVVLGNSGASKLLSAQELPDGQDGYHKTPIRAKFFVAGQTLFWTSYVVQWVNVARDLIIEHREIIARQVTWQTLWTAIIDPNVISVITGGISFGVLQEFYGKVFSERPMGVFTIEQAESDGSSVSCKRYGVLAETAKDAAQSKACHAFPEHEAGCQESSMGHTRILFGSDTCKDDPLVVHQTLFSGWSGHCLKFAFFAGCLLRFFDALADCFMETLKHGRNLCVTTEANEKGFSIDTWAEWKKRIVRKVAILRGYKEGYIGGLTGGVYDSQNFKKTDLGCCVLDYHLPDIVNTWGWRGKAASKMTSKCLFGVLTMTSLHLGVEEGCLAMNTIMGFSRLMVSAYIFAAVVIVGFCLIFGIVMWEAVIGFYYWMTEKTYEDDTGRTKHSRTLWFFFLTVVVLSVVSVFGYIFNTVWLLLHDLPKKSGLGIFLQVVEIIGEFAEAYQDNEDEKKAKNDPAANAERV